MPSQTVTLTNATGLHARPAKVFAQAAQEAAAGGAEVTLTKGDRTVNARSVLSVLTLDCHQGDEVTISVEGDGADEALARLVELVESGLGESDPPNLAQQRPQEGQPRAEFGGGSGPEGTGAS